MPIVAVQSVSTFGIQNGASRSTTTITLVAGTERALLLFGGYGSSGGGTQPGTVPAFGGVNMSSITSFTAAGTLMVNAWVLPISNGSSGDYALVNVKDIATDNFLGVALMLSGTSTSGISSQATGRTSVATAGFPNLVVPSSTASDMVFGFVMYGSGATVTHTQLGEGTAIVSNMTTGGTATGIYTPDVSLVSRQGDSSVSMQWTTAPEAAQRFRAISVTMPVTTVSDVPAGVNVESYQTYGIPFAASRSTTTFTLGSGTTRTLLVFGTYVNGSSGTANGPSVAPTFAGVSMPVYARPLTGFTSLMPVIYALDISDGSSGAYPLVCVKDAVNDMFEGVGFVLSNALSSGVTYTFAQSNSSGPAGLPQLIAPGNATLDYVFGFFAGASGSTITYTQLGEGTPIVSSMTPGASSTGVGTGVYVPAMSIVTVKGDSSVSLLWQISDGVTDAQRWRLFGLTVPVANDGSVFGPGAPYFVHRRSHSFDW